MVGEPALGAKKWIGFDMIEQSHHRLTYILDIPIVGFERIKQGELSVDWITRPHFDPVVDRSCENASTVEVDVQGNYFVVVECVELLDERHSGYTGGPGIEIWEVSRDVSDCYSYETNTKVVTVCTSKGLVLNNPNPSH